MGAGRVPCQDCAMDPHPCSVARSRRLRMPSYWTFNLQLFVPDPCRKGTTELPRQASLNPYRAIIKLPSYFALYRLRISSLHPAGATRAVGYCKYAAQHKERVDTAALGPADEFAAYTNPSRIGWIGFIRFDRFEENYARNSVQHCPSRNALVRAREACCNNDVKGSNRQ